MRICSYVDKKKYDKVRYIRYVYVPHHLVWLICEAASFSLLSRDCTEHCSLATKVHLVSSLVMLGKCSFVLKVPLADLLSVEKT